MWAIHAVILVHVIIMHLALNYLTWFQIIPTTFRSYYVVSTKVLYFVPWWCVGVTLACCPASSEHFIALPGGQCASACYIRFRVRRSHWYRWTWRYITLRAGEQGSTARNNSDWVTSYLQCIDCYIGILAGALLLSLYALAISESLAPTVLVWSETVHGLGIHHWPYSTARARFHRWRWVSVI